MNEKWSHIISFPATPMAGEWWALLGKPASLYQPRATLIAGKPKIELVGGSEGVVVTPALPPK
jgi:hypothetical protein